MRLVIQSSNVPYPLSERRLIIIRGVGKQAALRRVKMINLKGYTFHLSIPCYYSVIMEEPLWPYRWYVCGDLQSRFAIGGGEVVNFIIRHFCMSRHNCLRRR